MNASTILDATALAELFRKVDGRKLIVVVDCSDAVELCFEDDGGPNLVTIFTEGKRLGQVWLGGISGELLEQGYGRWDA